MPRKILAVLIILVLAGGAAMAEKIIQLPRPKVLGKMSLEESIFRRRSVRDYDKDRDVSLEELSQILWAAQGITDQGYGFRASPSAGALYPLHVYVVKKDGVFRYIPDGHKLVQISDQDLRPSLVRASLGQSFIRQAPVDIIISGNFAITQAKYGARAFRYVCMEIGHTAQNIHLQAVSLGLSSVPIGAFWDDVVKKNLELPDNQEPLYIIPIGFQKTGHEQEKD